MKKKITIIAFIIMVIIQLITLDIKEIDSINGKIENKKAENTSFSKDITYKWEWHAKSDNLMGYGLWTPSNAKDFQSVPLILYLHGWDGTVKTDAVLKGECISGIWNKSAWKNAGFENFCAYVLAPSEGTTSGDWKDSTSTNAVKKLLDTIISKYNIDKKNVIVCGHSKGGTGALYYASALSQYFSKCMAASPFHAGPFNKSMDTYTFFSWTADDAYPTYYNYCKNAFGEARTRKDTGGGHGSTFFSAVTDDSGKVHGTKGNKRSDLVEWMLKDWVPKPNISLDRVSLTLPTEQIKQIKIVSDDKNISATWTSSDKTVAEVDAKGVITALKEGKTTITAKVGTTELKCNVTVSGKLGDVDKDGTITSFDAYKTLKASVDSLTGTKIDEQTVLTSDVNKNTKVESEDAYEILKYSIGLINKF